jgi:hypothetical protein
MKTYQSYRILPALAETCSMEEGMKPGLSAEECVRCRVPAPRQGTFRVNTHAWNDKPSSEVSWFRYGRELKVQFAELSDITGFV